MMNKRLNYILEQSQGAVARVVDHMPQMLQKTLVKAFSYSDQYPNLDPMIKCILLAQQKQGDIGWIGTDIKKSREQFEKKLKSICKTVTKVKRVDDVCLPLQSGTIFARHYHPAPQKRLPMVVYYHGGGFALGSVESYDEVCRLLAIHAQVQVFSIDYPLAPETKPDKLIQTCEDALAWVYQNRKNLKIPKNKIAVAGDSAGGNIATVVAQRSLGKHHAPHAQLLIYPVTDFKNKYPSYYTYQKGLILTGRDIEIFADLYAKRGEIELDNPIISPLYGQLKKVAPAFIVTVTHDVFHDEGVEYAHQLENSGVKVCFKNYIDQTHGFVNLTPISKKSKKYTIEIFQEFRKFWNQQEGFFKGFFLNRFLS